MKINRKLLILFLVVIFTLAPLSFSNLFIFSQELGYQEISGYQEWTKDKIINEPVIINPGATLVIRKGVTITFNNWSTINVFGNFLVRGTVKNPVIFKKGENNGEFSIIITDSGKANFRNTDISGGGFIPPILVKRNNKLINRVNAIESAAIYVQSGGYLTMEGCDVHDNATGIYLQSTFLDKIKVNRSKFYNNSAYDVVYSNYSSNASQSLNFKYNWWADPNGPQKICPNCAAYQSIAGNINFSDWLTQKDFHDPVIIIPGIMGSWKWTNNGEWRLDPIFKGYDKLRETFEENGYDLGKDLFEFPYQWRDSNANNAKLLRDKIQEIKQMTNWPKVDVIAHSMGGLLAREYLESDYYQDDIDQFVTLGTPHNGAPKSYLTWEGGEVSGEFDLFGIIARSIFKQEAEKSGYKNIFDYIRNLPMKSIQELLPVYGYLKNAGELRNYPSDNYPLNPFLEKLNLPENLKKLEQVEFTNVIGKTENIKSTIETIRTEEVSDDLKPKWEHGYPENYDSLFGDHGLEFGEGDETVPLSSAQNISSDSQIVTTYTHGDLPSKAANIIYETVTGYLPSKDVPFQGVNSLLFIGVFSPIDIQIIAPDGKRAGKDFQTGEILNEIEGTYYTGYDTATEFLTIPNPMDGEYQILTQGTGEGEYRIEATKIAQNPENPQQALESTGIIEGTATPGQTEEKTIKIKDNEVIAETKDSIPPTIAVISPQENQKYSNDQTLAIDYQIQDNVASKENIRTEIYLDQNKLESKNIDLSLLKLNEHEIKITATDESQNRGEKEITFETTTDPDAIIKNINHYFDLKLIKKESEKRILTEMAERIKRIQEFLQKTKDNPKISNKAKIKLTEAVKKHLNRNIDFVIKYIRQRPEKFIDQKAKELLIGSLDYLKELW